MKHIEEFERNVNIVKRLGGEILKARLDNKTTLDVLERVKRCIWRLETINDDINAGYPLEKIKQYSFEMLEFVNDDITELKKLYADVLVEEIGKESKIVL